MYRYHSNVLIRSARALSPEAYPAIRTMPSSWSRTELETDGYSWPMLQLTAFFFLSFQESFFFSKGDAVDAIPTSAPRRTHVRRLRRWWRQRRSYRKKVLGHATDPWPWPPHCIISLLTNLCIRMKALQSFVTGGRRGLPNSSIDKIIH